MADAIFPSQEMLCKRLECDPDTGVLTWRRRPGDGWRDKFFNTRFAGKIAGPPRPYCRGKRMRCAFTLIAPGCQREIHVHRAVWTIVHGAIPEGMEIDHINGNPTDNRLCNLRLATRRQNAQNKAAWGRSGILGVRRNRSGTWRATIRDRYLGSFRSLDAAVSARREAEASLFGAFAPSLSRTNPSPCQAQGRHASRRATEQRIPWPCLFMAPHPPLRRDRG